MKRTNAILDLLRAYECRNTTFIEADGSWPIVWARARGCHVWDAEGRRYLDLTAAFGVAAAGHANPRVVRAGQRQMAVLLHAMGDVHPHALKARLARELSRITFESWARARVETLKRSNVEGSNPLSADGAAAAALPPWSAPTPRRSNASTLQPFNPSPCPTAKTLFTNSGFEAVEAALKTALLATGKPGVIAFEGAYHGLGYGALNATHRDLFRSPFRRQLRAFADFVPFPVSEADLGTAADAIRRILRRGRTGAILVEPIQGRGGIQNPPRGFLPTLRQLGDEQGVLLIADEIYTGFGRTGRWFACEHSGVTPDLICLGKALTGGFPLSACVGRADLMDAAWPESTGEAIHTSTFLGHPVGCAMALAQIAEIRRLRLVQRSARLGRWLCEQLHAAGIPDAGGRRPGTGGRGRRPTIQMPETECRVGVRGVGLMVGLDLRHRDGSPATDAALRLVKSMLRRGFILLPEGEHANVIGLTPPLTISDRQLGAAIEAIVEELT